ncbi:hypothetical protein QBC40DRAFT_289742 [Triangularia verruculosa]|uniref:Uncharacterized protein n=1 Tax=Triangularia verruculosa TaxID=2587418 RepID=A0AAN6X6V0_9PEZI|nr:hypothetical protein QBC40DRAFT_289742 [Triangularia verruculosa]
MSIRALVVGGTNGIGYAMACRLAGENPSSRVVISGRNKPDRIPNPNIDFRALDASSMRQIKRYTDEFKSSHQDQQLDFLIMTQGIFTMAGRTETAEGIDNKMALHYYGKQLLIRELLPVLKNNARVIIVLDGKIGAPAKLDWKDLDLKQGYSLPSAAYHCISMNDAMVQFHATQQKQNGNTQRHFIHAFPGVVASNLMAGLPWYLRAPSQALMRMVAVSTDTCAEHMLRGTSEVSEIAEKDGRFWGHIDQKGREVPGKAIWTEEQLKTISDHTWGVIDDALKCTS